MSCLKKENDMEIKDKGKKTEHILICLSSSPSNRRIIQCAGNMASAFHGTLTALFVETPEYPKRSEEDKKRLQENMEFAKQMGAQIETVYGEDISFQIAEFARLSGVTKIVIGRSAIKKRIFFWKSGLTDKLLYYAPDVDIHIIPDSDLVREEYAPDTLGTVSRFQWQDVCNCILLLTLSTVLAMLFHYLGLSDANIITVYILSVLLVSIKTTSYRYYLFYSLIAVITFNFLFTEPKYTFLAYDAGYPFTFLIMFAASCISGNLASRLNRTAKQNARVAYRTQVLFETEHLLIREKGEESIATLALEQLVKLFRKNGVLYLIDANGRMNFVRSVLFSDGENTKAYELDREKHAALAVLQNPEHTSQDTSICNYYPIRMNHNIYGVIGIDFEGHLPDPFEVSILNSILGECALALNNDRNAKEKEEASLQAQNEKTRANLVRSISHDFRTPLTTISGNAANLMRYEEQFDSSTRQKLYKDIYEDAIWLESLVENVLSISRIEDGTMKLQKGVELMDEIITEAVKHLDQKANDHQILISCPEEMILVKVEPRLIVQVIINLVNNAIKYTPAGSMIRISLKQEDGFAVVAVEDNGPGIEDTEKEKIFEMFYTGKKKMADSRRSLGLGLALCRSIILAHGGVISARNNDMGGTSILFSLPIEEVVSDE